MSSACDPVMHTQPSKPASAGRATDFQSLAPREGRVFDSRIPSYFYLVMGRPTMVWYILLLSVWLVVCRAFAVMVVR